MDSGLHRPLTGYRNTFPFLVSLDRACTGQRTESTDMNNLSSHIYLRL